MLRAGRQEQQIRRQGEQKVVTSPDQVSTG
jgi:hypothetical protein